MIAEMNFAIRYLTRYDYDAEVVDNLNPLRVKPHANGPQRCDEFSVRLNPEVRLHRHSDYFGTEVVEFEVSRPHRQLTIEDLFEAGAGVCQDFVHLGLSLLRHHGIAARYVSGYLFAAGSESSQESVEVDTHAWLEALLPLPGAVEPMWVGADPTNRSLVGENHVKIGHGRHYADVPPIKGIYRGTANAKLDARITMTRLERVDPASIARSWRSGRSPRE